MTAVSRSVGRARVRTSSCVVSVWARQVVARVRPCGDGPRPHVFNELVVGKHQELVEGVANAVVGGLDRSHQVIQLCVHLLRAREQAVGKLLQMQNKLRAHPPTDGYKAVRPAPPPPFFLIRNCTMLRAVHARARARTPASPARFHLDLTAPRSSAVVHGRSHALSAVKGAPPPPRRRAVEVSTTAWHHPALVAPHTHRPCRWARRPLRCKDTRAPRFPSLATPRPSS